MHASHCHLVLIAVLYISACCRAVTSMEYVLCLSVRMLLVMHAATPIALMSQTDLQR